MTSPSPTTFGRSRARTAAGTSPSDYVATLEAAWRDHLAPRAPDAPTVVSTFAGCGGSSLGYSMAGFRERLAVEWDDHAAACFRANFPDVPLHHGDIAALSVEDAFARTGLRPGELDVLDGSPPCQGFSTAGKRAFGDARNQLFREYVRLLGGLRPRAFVMENVSGMVKGAMRLTFAECLRALKACDYRVTARVLNAMYFGVPQARARLIFVGVRADLGLDPTHPGAQTRPVAVREALGYDGFGGFGSGRETDRVVPFCRPSPTVMKDGLANGARHQFFVAAERVGSRLVEDLPAPPLTGKTAAIAARLAQGQRGSDLPGVTGWQDSLRLHPARPAPTVLKEGALWKRYPKLVHPHEFRGLSIGELKRLSSFPDAFHLLGPWVEAWARVGNSVPPLLMRAIARHLRATVLAKPAPVP